MDHHKLFDTAQDFADFSNDSSVYNDSLVAYVEETDKVHWPAMSLLDRYFAIEALEDDFYCLWRYGFGVFGAQYSYDGITWTNWPVGGGPTLNKGEMIYVKGTKLFKGVGSNSQGFLYGAAHHKPYKVKGNIMSMFYGDNGYGKTVIPDGANISYLFYNTKLVDASELQMPATTLTTNCYAFMFYGTWIKTHPKLPATTMVNGCYQSMFRNIVNLERLELPATTLADSCYGRIWQGASEEANRKLNYIKFMAIDAPTSIQVGQMTYVYRFLPDEGTFVMNAAATWNPEDYRYDKTSQASQPVAIVPAGWTVYYEDATGNLTPATQP